MENILYPQQRRDKGPEVRNLQDALIALSDTEELKELRAFYVESAFRETLAKEIRENFYGEATVQAISAFQEKYMKVNSSGAIDETTAAALNALLQKYGFLPYKPVHRVVQGTVYDEWIEPLGGVRVKAFDQGIRNEHLLGEAKTNEQGHYHINYTREELSGADKGGANVIVRVYLKGDKPAHSSDTYFDAPEKLKVDINMGPRAYMGPSEFSSAIAAIKPFTGKLEISELTENDKVHDLSFLLSKTKLAANVLLRLAAAFRFEKWTSLEAEVYYGVLAQSKDISTGSGNALPLNVEATIEQAYINFWGLSVSSMMDALQQAADKNQVCYKLIARSKAINTELQKARNAPPQIPGGTITLPAVYNKITIAGLSAAQQQVFLENYSPENAGPAFWTTLSSDPNFSTPAGQAALGKLQVVFQLSGWTADNTDLVSYLVRQQKINSSADLASLVDNDVNDWVNIINTSGTIPATTTGQAETVQAVATSIATGIERIYPTQVFTSRLKKNTAFTLTNRDYITGVLSSNDFDITKTSIGPYLNTYAQKNPVAENTDIKTVTYQVMGMQRVYKASQSADASIALLSDNIQSARQIYAMGKSNFVGKYSTAMGGDDAAGAMYEQASQIHTGATFLAGKLISALNNPSTNTMTDYNGQVKNSKFLNEYPDLAGLFGMPASYCECVDCESFLGIPAYLADLLDYLYQRQPKSGPNARALLLANNYASNGLQFRRRPDIGDIDLNCDNANTELPYIDIVNELLEDYVIPPVTAIKMILADKNIESIYLDFLIWLAVNLAAGKIPPDLYALLMQIGDDPKTPICNINLLTPDAVVSSVFYSDGENYPGWMMSGFPLIAEWVIRDTYITLKVSLIFNAQSVNGLDEIFGSDLIVSKVKPYKNPFNKYINDLGSVFTKDVINEHINAGNHDVQTRYFALVVQETHQTHLSTAEINANPEYTNTNVYNCLSDPFNTYQLNKWGLYPTLIPQSLPYDLYFDEANTFLEKMGMQRYSLMTTYRPSTAPSIFPIVYEYMGLSAGDSDIIFNARVQVKPQPDPQLLFWGSLVGPQPEVDLFLKASGLDFEQLQTLLTLQFINPLGDSYIASTYVAASSGYWDQRLPPPTVYDTCNTALMVITAMTSEKFDAINRFLRLWNKLNLLTTISMQELDKCIMCAAIGDESLDADFAGKMYYFLQLMQLLSLTATQALAFYQDIDTTGDGNLYQQLFQNRQISNPLVAAFNLPLPGTGGIMDAQANPGAAAVILAACGITQDDLTAIMDLNSPEYTLLTVDSLSFIYACGLLAGALSISVSDLFTLTNLFGFNPIYQILPAKGPAYPQTTFEFITLFNEIQQAGLSVDDFNYILCNQSTANPSLIPASATVVTGLESIRTALQAAVAATTVVPDPKGTLLTKWLADPDLGWDKTIAAKVLSILGVNDGTYTAQVQSNLRMLQLLRTYYSESAATAYLDRLPAITFPDTTIANIQYDNTNYYLFFNGALSEVESQFLNQLPAIDAAGQTAVQNLYQQSQTCPISAIPVGSSVPAWVSGNQAQITQNVPGFSCGTGALGFKGTMTAPVYSSLLAQSSDAVFGCALGQLLIASQGTGPTATSYVQLGALPAIALPDAAAASLAWSGGTLSFSGAMSAADCRALLGLATDAVYQAAICQLFITAQPGQTVSTPLASLPSGWAVLPDLSTIAGLSTSTGVIQFAGQMSSAVQSALSNLSAAGSWGTNVTALFNQSQSTTTTTVPIAALPAGVTDASFGIYGVTDSTPGGQTTPILLTYAGVMSNYTLDGLLTLSADPGWAAAVTTLYQNTQANAVTTVTLPQPSGINTALFATYQVNYSEAGSIMSLSFTGQMQAQVQASLLAMSTDATYATAINALFSKTSAIFGASLPSIDIPLADSGLGAAAYTPGAIVFTGTPNLQCNDAFNLEQLSADMSYVDAIGFIYNQTPLPSGTVGAVLSSLPPVSFPSSINISWAQGELSFTGQMQTAERDTLLGLSTNPSYQAAVTILYNNSQITAVTWLPAEADGSFPDGIAASDLNTNGVTVQNSGQGYILSFTGLMTSAQQTALLALVPPATDDVYTQAIQTLFTGSQAIMINTTPLAALPQISIPTAAMTAGWGYDPGNAVLYYSGALPIPSATVAMVSSLNSTDPDFVTAIKYLSGVAANPGDLLVFAPPPQTTFAASGLNLSNGATISYQGGTLAFTGPMSFADYIALLSFSTDAGYRAAVNNVYITSQTSASNVTVNSENYFDLPEITFPAMYANQVSFAPASSTLTLRGYITAADAAILNSLGTYLLYQQALDTVYNSINTQNTAAGSFFPQLYATLLTGTAASSLPDRYAYFLNTISTDYLAFKERDALTAQIAANFGVSTAVAGVLGALVFGDFTATSFVGNSKAVNPDPDQFPLAKWFIQLNRMAFLINTFNFSSADVSWLLTNGDTINALDLTAWPSTTNPLQFNTWQILNNLWTFQKKYKPITIADVANPGQNVTLSVYDIISGALAISADVASSIPSNPGYLLNRLTLLTKWNPVQLAYMLNVGQPNLPGLILNPLQLPDTGIPPIGCIPALSDIGELIRLSNCFAAASQLRVVPSRCVTWVTNPLTDAIATDIKQALKAIFPDDSSWMSAIQPLMNSLRQDRRNAMVAYIESNTVSNPFGNFDIFPDEFAVYGNFLIDVEMAACQPTTRTIQAYCAIQLYVQRCLLNLESPNIQVDSSLDEDWLQWSWMGTFEGWYQARYTFLYPENLILPEALPNQSSFFEDMQNDLTQGAVTVDIVEGAFGNYLESLDQVARLEVKGMWYDDASDTLHVFARNYGGDPAVYYYRTQDSNTGRWSPWEQVTADISGDLIIPVMQNGRLYLYWPIFTQATDSDKATQTQSASTGGGNSTISSPPPPKYWKIQMAFSEYKNGQWTGKKVSKDYLQSPPINYTGTSVVVPDTSDFVFIALDIPDAVPGGASGAEKYAAIQQSLKMNNTMAIACYCNYTQYDSDGNPMVASAGTSLQLLQTGGAPNSFQLDALRGYPSAIPLSALLGGWAMLTLLFIGDDSRFDNTWYNDMLLQGALPLTPLQLGSKQAAVLSNPNNPSYNTLLSLQMGLWAKWSYVDDNNNIINPDLLGTMMPFFFQDSAKTFFVNQMVYSLPGVSMPAYLPYFSYADAKAAFIATSGNSSQLQTLWNQTGNLAADSGPVYLFNNFYHPFTHQFIRIFAQLGIESVLARPIQLTGDYEFGTTTDVLNNLIINIKDNPSYKDFDFKGTYNPSSVVFNGFSGVSAYPIDQMDFGLFSAYGQYNWELFFHGVLMSAMRLSQNQQFEDADTWFKFIFNPTDTSGNPAPQKFWVTKPFFENKTDYASIDELILLYEADPTSQWDFWQSVKLWRNDPYDPHMLAQYRITPYMYTTFMKYLDNLIAWANYNYTQYTMESVNIAIQLFMTALECLGPEPEAIPPVAETPVCSYYQLELDLEVLSAIDGKEGYLSDPIVQFENLIPPAPGPGWHKPGSGVNTQKVQMLPGLYFCIPPNQVLLGYWDTINTQLTKIRNCMNIKGQFQPLNPFPSIPGMGGMEGSSVSDWGGVIPNYRFSVMIQKAAELCNEVKSLGGSLLSALEKNDAEGLSILRATQEVSVQNAVDLVRQLQITDANLGLQNLLNYQSLINDKISYYSGLLQAGLLSLEQQALALNQKSISLEGPIAAGTMLAGIFRQLPNFTIGINGAFGSPAATATFGGISLGEAADCAVQALSFTSHFSDRSATLATTNAGYTRRAAEWSFQLTLAKDELAQVNVQIQAAQNKIAIATQEEQNQQLLIQNAEDVESFLQNKYTNQQLYSWMITQLSNVYFQSYQLAYSVAKQAEICFRYELGIMDTSYINYGYWDSLHKGLLSGEALMSNIRQMEMDYLNMNAREYELTRQISLAQFDPVALLQLKANRTCFINIPEELFDLDYPGHYFRRVKHIAITIPGVVGPYTPVCLKMTLMNNSIRVDNTSGSASTYPRHTDSTGAPTNDSRFIDNAAPLQFIATSNGVNDSGLFEMNLHDDRYLPFERAGAISSWQIEFSSVYPQFDPSTVTDLIIHFSYTSRDGGALLQTAASQSVQSKLKNVLTTSEMVLMRAFSARRDFPTQWYQFLNPANPADSQQLLMDITQRFPYFTNGLTIKVSQVVLIADIPAGNPGSDALSDLYISGQKLSNALINFGPDPEYGQMIYAVVHCKDGAGKWKITNGTAAGAPANPVTAGDINDLAVIFYYSVVASNT